MLASSLLPELASVAMQAWAVAKEPVAAQVQAAV